MRVTSHFSVWAPASPSASAMLRCPTASRRLSELLASLGLDYYITAVATVFRGKIKQRPEDFVVTELYSDGQLVTLNSTGSPYQTDTTEDAPMGGVEPLSNHQKTNDNPQTGSEVQFHESTPLSGLTKHQTEPSESPPTCEGPLTNHQSATTPHLDMLVSGDIYQQLVSMAASYGATASTEPPQSLNLGVVGEKSERRWLHRAVRQAFPQLSTATHTGHTGGREIHVAMDTNYPRLRALLGHEEACRLLKFLNVDRESGCGLLLNPDPCKKHRTEVHRALGELYGRTVVTHAHTAKRARSGGGASGQSQQILVQFRSRKGQSKSEGAEKPEVFTKFVLRKENVETLEAVSVLSQAMDCHTSQLAYAGSKDARAITTQCMTVRGVTPSQLATMGPLPHISIGNFQPVHRHIRLGGHGGNHFKILIRDFGPLIPLDPHAPLGNIVEECIKSLEEKGFVNYFGPQRFGYRPTSRGFMSPHIGLAMLQGNHFHLCQLFHQLRPVLPPPPLPLLPLHTLPSTHHHCLTLRHF